MKRTPLRRISKKRQRELREYSKAKQAYFERLASEQGVPPVCEICQKRQAVDWHHIQARGNGGPFLPGDDGMLAVCRWCHKQVHENPSWSRERGYLK